MSFDPKNLWCLVRIAIVFFACSAVIAQTPPATEPVIDQSKMVVLNVRVADENGHAITELGQDVFRTAEDGIPQKISLFSKAEIPITYGLVIDCSGSLRAQLDNVVRAGARIVESSKAEDEGFLIRFISTDKIEMIQDITGSKRRLIDGLENLYVEGGQTAVVDAVYLAAERLVKRRAEDRSLRRQALVLITDGEDRKSQFKKEQLFDLLRSADIQIYAIGFKGDMKEKSKEPAKELLTRLATATGGRVFFPQSNGELTTIADEIVNDLRSQYVIGYIPTDQKATTGFHKVEVTIADNANKEKRIAITRLGYSAPKWD
jgi:Ca-activated chloride channel family protein